MRDHKKLIELKYKVAWYAGATISFLLFISGIISLYVYVRRRFLKSHIAIVLMYHRIGYNNAPDMSVSDKNFEFQIAYLKKYYSIVSIDELLNIYKNNLCI